MLLAWARVSLIDELRHRAGIDVREYATASALVDRVRDLGIETRAEESRGRLIDKLLSLFVEPHLIQPTFVIDYPVDMSPLAKQKPEDNQVVERFEAYVGGMEIANAYTELNDPDIQRERLQAQEELRLLYKDEDVDRLDEDFLLSLEYGMPPTGGLGVGIDRLVMLLTGQPSIRDAVLFPQMRPVR